MKPKHLVVTITAEDSDDKGKNYLITKMKAAPLEDWAMRLILALLRSGIEIPPDIVSSGFAGLVRYGLSGALSQIRIEELRELASDMMDCVTFLPDLNDRSFSRPLVDSDIEEVSTRYELRMKWAVLHTGFSTPDAPSTLKASGGMTQGQPSSPNTATSRKPSRR